MRAVIRAWMDEYRGILSDAGVMLIFFGAIAAYSIMYPIPYFSEVLRDVPVAVVDLDRSSLSRKLVRMIDANEYVRAADKTGNFESAKALMLAREVSGVVVIPADFSKKILRSEQSEVPVYLDGSYFLTYRQTLTGLMQAVGTLSAGIEIRRMEARGTHPVRAAAERDPLPMRSYALFNPSGGYASYIVPAVFLLLLQQSLLIGIGMRAGTAREQKPSRIRGPAPAEVLGKAAAYFSIYLIHAIYLFMILFRVYRFPQRADLGALAMVIIPFLAASIFLGLALSAVFKTRETSMLVLLCTSLPVLFLAGFAWPRESIPQWLQTLSLAVPSTGAIKAFLEISQMGADISQVAGETAILWILAAVYFAAACVLGSASRRRKDLL